MFCGEGAMFNASIAAKMSTAHPSRLGTFAGRSRFIRARAASGSIRGSRGAPDMQAVNRSVTAVLKIVRSVNRAVLFRMER
jgi:hypothetical protein